MSKSSPNDLAEVCASSKLTGAPPCEPAAAEVAELEELRAAERSSFGTAGLPKIAWVLIVASAPPGPPAKRLSWLEEKFKPAVCDGLNRFCEGLSCSCAPSESSSGQQKTCLHFPDRVRRQHVSLSKIEPPSFSSFTRACCSRLASPNIPSSDPRGSRRPFRSFVSSESSCELCTRPKEQSVSICKVSA